MVSNILVTERIREILSWYGSDNPGTLTNLSRLLNHGKLAGTGKLVILPVDRGFEHGPARSFAANPPAYAAEAKRCGLAVVIWSYARGSGVSTAGETAILDREASPTMSLPMLPKLLPSWGHILSKSNYQPTTSNSRLRADLRMNLVGAAIVLNLAQEVAQLRAQLDVYRSQPHNPL